MPSPDLDQLSINTIRILAMDAVQRANPGHPGTPMATAPVAHERWQRHLRFDPEDPIWPRRDRFGLSMGHASMPLKDLQKKFGFAPESVAAAKEQLARRA